ncbi:DUF3817 domain-containing protein [Pantoea ananatis]|uniref:DUF3817 domain-containing protein n=1 Tax=Pantoea ananas TaxID=553 RepID=UPI00221FDC29|nr:DUF3817 domain-containing protein [Pantoea ananatis]
MHLPAGVAAAIASRPRSRHWSCVCPCRPGGPAVRRCRRVRRPDLGRPVARHALKYGTQTTELGVWLFGRLHGVAFLLYVVASLLAALRLRWPWWAWALSLLAALPPLVTVPLEVWFRRIGLLGAQAQSAVE